MKKKPRSKRIEVSKKSRSMVAVQPREQQRMNLKKGHNGRSSASKKVHKNPLKRKWQKLVTELLLTFSIFLFLMVPLFLFVIHIPQNAGYAMTPNLRPEQRVVVYRYGEIKRFSYVYFKVPQRDDGLKTIRRVIGLPGERIEYKSDQLFVNGEEKAERFLSEMLSKATSGGYRLTQDFSIADLATEERIPEGYYLVLGDNRSFSVDSRTYGLVPEKDILGTVELLL